MSTQLVIRLKKELATVTYDVMGGEAEIIDWVPALIAAATEVQVLNGYAGTDDFPRPISCNPDAMVWVPEIPATEPVEGLIGYQEATPAHWSGKIEGFLGSLNTPPTADGMVTIIVDEYEWIDVSLLPALPQTFAFILGTPKHAGTVL